MLNYQFLLEIDALDASNDPVTLYFCCAPGFSSSGKSWNPNIVDPGLMQVDLFSNGKTNGASTYSFGEIVLGNFKNTETLYGPIDWFKSFQFFGRPVRMFVGLASANYDDGGFTLAYTAIIDNISTEWDTFALSLHGRQAELDIPINTAMFLGNNTPPNGIEGDAALKDKLKPVLVGRALNFSPVLCNASKLIYACSIQTGLSADEMGSDLHVYDKGVEIACSGVVSLSTLQSTAPPVGQYSVTTDGYIRLGSSPAGTVTVSGAATGYALTSHPAILINAILTAAGFNSGDARDMLDTNSFNAYATDRWERGLFIGSSTNISDVIDSLLAPLGYWYFDASGVARFGIMSDPAGKTPVYSLHSDTNISVFSVAKSQDTAGGIPAKSVGITHGINYTVMTDAAGSVSADRMLWLKNAYLTAVKASTNTIHPLSENLVIGSCIIDETAAALSMLHDLYTVEREIITIEVLNTPEEFNTARVLNPGDIVSVDLKGRFYYSGKPTVLIGKTVNYVNQTVTLRLWS